MCQNDYYYIPVVKSYEIDIRKSHNYYYYKTHHNMPLIQTAYEFF